MVEVSQEEFEKLVSEAIDRIPPVYYKKLNNVAFITEDEPSETQRQELKLHCNQSLYGLYQGIPLTKRGNNYNLVLPDKITIFRLPILYSAHNLEDVRRQVNNTVWHEVAHYYGLDHDRIHKLEKKPPSK
ncbi:MAG TPA: metallopeptidase family protein [Candidatus Saccharimonadales bacterium]|nr:metallopeptidase family protein [Candidatus Saccharimonadales bacterium]